MNIISIINLRSKLKVDNEKGRFLKLYAIDKAPTSFI